MTSIGGASQACRACRKLKRRCSKDLPACSLCIRLGKSCQYPPATKPMGVQEPEELDRQTLIETVRELRERLKRDEQYFQAEGGLSVTPTSSTYTISGIQRSSFPNAFFLDPDYVTPITFSQRMFSEAAHSEIMRLLGPKGPSICHEYLNGVQDWFPFASPKRVRQGAEAATDTTVALLVLSMQLISGPHDSPVQELNEVYDASKRLLSVFEDASMISLSLLQAIIVISVYEIGQGLFPAAYLSVGRAARLGLMMGLHNRNTQQVTQLYKTANSWSLSEEKRRTWWAVIILDRYLNLGPKGLPLACPDPGHGDLLPCDDVTWDQGEIGPNEPVYASKFSDKSILGTFARTCQSAHMLGRVIRHRDTTHADRVAQLEEALQLHHALTKLEEHLTQANPRGDAEQIKSNRLTGLALCYSSRLSLYNLYACNEPDSEERIGKESEMQALALQGIRSIAGERVPVVARKLLHELSNTSYPSPLMIQCLYHAATECRWFVREEIGSTMESSLHLIVEALRHLGKRWKVADMYCELLSSTDEDNSA